MSLDVYLYEDSDHTQELFWSNITHNLNVMANELQVYTLIWRPEEIYIFKANQLIEPLQSAAIILEANPQWFKKFNPTNNWGSYDGLLRFINDYLAACQTYPEAFVHVSR